MPKGLGQPLPVSVCTECGLAGHVKATCPDLHPAEVIDEVSSAA